MRISYKNKRFSKVKLDSVQPWRNRMALGESLFGVNVAAPLCIAMVEKVEQILAGSNT
jgi:hypothetical protein